MAPTASSGTAPRRSLNLMAMRSVWGYAWCGARALTRTRTYTYAELGGMTRRLPVDRAFLYLGDWAHDHRVRSCPMPRTPRQRWAPMAPSAPGPTRRRPLTPARQRAQSRRNNHGGPGSGQCPITPPRVSRLPRIALAPKFWASTSFTVPSPPRPVTKITIMDNFSILTV